MAYTSARWRHCRLPDTDTRCVLLDVNVLTRLSEIDPQCELVEYIAATFDGECCIDERQASMAPCPCQSWSNCQTIDLSDEEAGTLISALSIKDIDKLLDEPGDFRLTAYAIGRRNSIMVSCDRRILILCSKIPIEHYCFKAVMKKTDRFLGGDIFQSGRYPVCKMSSPSRDNKNPFFHFGVDKHCPQCDPAEACHTRQDLAS